MTSFTHDSPPTFDPPIEEAWVVHAALLSVCRDAIEDGDDPPRELELVRDLETGRDFRERDLRRIQDALVSYLGDAPVRDRAPGRRALGTVREILDASSPTA